MFDWVALFDKLVNIARKDKVLALIAVLFLAVGASSYVTRWVVLRSDAKEAKTEAKADVREANCDSTVKNLNIQIAALNVKLYELARDQNKDLINQRDKFQDIVTDRDNLVRELQLANKRNARALKNLAPENEIKNEN